MSILIHTYVLTDVFTPTENVLNLLRSDLKELIEEENHIVFDVNEKMDIDKPPTATVTLRSKMSASENLNILLL